jgi:hypothetical protein
MDHLRHSPPREASSSTGVERLDRATASVEARRIVSGPSQLTLTHAELVELTGYHRGAEQKRWLTGNGFKYRLDCFGKPRVDRAHYIVKMGGKPTTGVKGPDWDALAD